MVTEGNGTKDQRAPATSGRPAVLEARLPWLAAIVISVAAAGAYIWLADWPAGTHQDELKKVSFILSGKQDFDHPILSLQLARIANYFLGYTSVEDTLRLGRTISGLFGGLLVFSTFVLGRLVLVPVTAAAAAAAVAVTPLIVFHATFLKEDIYFAGPAILGLAAVLVLLDRPSWRNAAVAGLALGVAVSAKYVAVLFLVYAIAVVAILSRETIGARLRYCGMMLLVSALVFIAVNATALLEHETFLKGISFEVGHATTGHDVLMPVWLTGGIMHLRDSLLPGLGFPLVVIGLAGLSSPLLNRARRRFLAIIACAAVVWYLAHEISPLKPYPDFVRYVVPEGPLLVVLGAAFLEILLTWRARLVTATVGPAAVLLLCAAPAAYSTYEIAHANAHDPRRIASQVFAHLDPQTLFDPYVNYGGEMSSPNLDRSRAIKFLVTSSFVYERLARYGNDPSQWPSTREAYDFYYHDLFTKPYLELASGGPSFGFLNPTVRIVALDGDIERLTEIGQAAIEADPFIHIKIDVGP